jgi:hypothetical protein
MVNAKVESNKVLIRRNRYFRGRVGGIDGVALTCSWYIVGTLGGFVGMPEYRLTFPAPLSSMLGNSSGLFLSVSVLKALSWPSTDD